MVYNTLIKRHKKKSTAKEIAKLLSVFFLITMILMAGPASAVSISMSNVNDSYTVGDTITPTFTSTFSGTTSQKDQVTADSNIQWDLIDSGGTVVSTGSKTFSSFADSNSEFDLNTADNNYGFWRHGYGYGYGAGTLKWSPSISTSSLSAGSYTLRIKIVNDNGTVTYQDKSITLSEAAAITLAAGSSGAGAGGSPGEKPGTRELMALETTETFTPRAEEAEEIKEILEEAGLSQEEIQSAQENIENFSFERSLEVKRVLDVKEQKVHYESNFTLTVSNKTSQAQKNIKVVETIPKSVAEHASEITSPHSFRLLKADPVLEFLIESLAPNQEIEIKYSVKKKVEETAFKEMTSPVALPEIPTEITPLEEIAEDLCLGINCNDRNPCTIDSCVKGECVYRKAIDGTLCPGGQCQGGKCQAIKPIAAPLTTLPEKEVAFPLMQAMVNVVVTIIIITGIILALINARNYFSSKNRPKRGRK